MLVIRYNTVGRKNHKQYRIVLQEKTQAPGGRHVAMLGSYDPHTKETILKADEIKDWIAKGAQPSDSVYNLLVRNDIIKGEKRKVKVPEKKIEEEVKEEKKEEAPAEAPTEAPEEKKEESSEEPKDEAPKEGVKDEPTEKKEEK